MTFMNLTRILSRTSFPANLHSILFFKKYARTSHFKNMTIRTFSSKFVLSKSNVKSISPCFLEHNAYSKKVIASFSSKHSINYGRYFHTSERRYLHPVFWAVLRPLFKVLAIFTGRAFRKWWKDLPPNKKKYFWQVIRENRHKIAAFVIGCVALSMVYYVSHLEETPMTKRKRFMAFSPKQLAKINQLELQQIMQKMQSQILPDNHPSVYRVKVVVNRILEANKDIKEVRDKKWGVSVINSSIENAFVLPIGHVFVFTGMLTLCANDDELGIILSHEIAHCIQNHGAEKISFTHVLDLISIIIIAAIWAVLPSDTLSIFTHWLYHNCIKILFELPYNRKIETEADTVGLQLAAKACFDVRESSAFWNKMSVLHNMLDKGPDVEFLSTHPSHEKRSEYLDSIMDEAIKFRNECGCPKLKPKDPRFNIEVIAKALDAARRSYLQQNPKPAVPFYTV